MKRNRLNRLGQAPASGALPPKGALTCAVLQKEATPWQGTGRQLAVTRDDPCLCLKCGEGKMIFRSRTPAVQTMPILHLISWVSVHRAQLLGCPLPPATVLPRGGRHLHRCLPTPGKRQSSISSRSLNTE